MSMNLVQIKFQITLSKIFITNSKQFVKQNNDEFEKNLQQIPTNANVKNDTGKLEMEDEKKKIVEIQ